MAKSRSAKAIILASGTGLTTLVQLVIAAVLARVLSKLDYATYRQTFLAYTFAAPIVTLGLNRALLYFLPAEEERPRGVLLENLIPLTLGGSLLGAFLLLGGNELLAYQFDNPALSETLLILAPYPLVMLPLGSLGACLVARERTEQVAVFNVVSRITVLAIVLTACLLWTRPDAVIAAMVGATALTAVGGTVLMLRACPGRWRPTWKGMRKQLVYSVPLGLALLVGTITLLLDKVMVSAMCPPTSFAVYVNGAMEIPFIGIVTGSVTSILIVEYTRLYGEGRIAEIVALIHRAMVKCALILLPSMCLLLCVAPELMRFVYGKTYTDSAVPFRIYLLLLPIRTLMFSAILMATGRTRHVLIQSILTLLANVALTWAFINMFGPNGAAVATVCVVYCVAVPYFVIVIRGTLKTPVLQLFPWGELLMVGLASSLGVAGVLAAKHLLAAWPDFVVLVVGGSVYATTTLALFWWFQLVDLGVVARRVVGTLDRRA